jgi:hypothetical protein
MRMRLRHTSTPATALTLVALATFACRARHAVPASSGTDAPTSDAAACVLGGSTPSAPVTIACDQRTPARLVVDANNVYWTVETPGAVVMKAALSGGAAQTLVQDSGAAFGLAVDATYVYFTQPAAGRVMRVPIAGGAAVPLATQVDGPLSLAIDGASLYWTGGTAVGSIMKLPLRDGATATVLLTGLGRPRAIAVDGGFVFWTDFADGSVLRAPTADADGGAPPTPMRLTYGLKQPADLVVLGGYAYVPDQAGRVLRVPVAGGAPEKLADTVGVPFGIGCDGVFVYWSTLGQGTISKTAITGLDPVQSLATGQADPHFLVLAADAIYWGNWGDGGTVNKIAK